MISFIDRLPRRGKQICALLADAFVLGLSIWAALTIGLESFWLELEPSLDGLEAALDQHDASRVRSILRKLVSGYGSQVQTRESHI